MIHGTNVSPPKHPTVHNRTIHGLQIIRPNVVWIGNLPLGTPPSAFVAPDAIIVELQPSSHGIARHLETKACGGVGENECTNIVLPRPVSGTDTSFHLLISTSLNTAEFFGLCTVSNADSSPQGLIGTTFLTAFLDLCPMPLTHPSFERIVGAPPVVAAFCLRRTVPNAYSSSLGLVVTPLVAADWLLCPVPHTNSSLNGRVGAPFMATSFLRCPVRDADTSPFGEVSASFVSAHRPWSFCHFGSLSLCRYNVDLMRIALDVVIVARRFDTAGVKARIVGARRRYY